MVTRSDKQYKVIDGKSIDNFKEDEFFWPHNRRSKEDFFKFVKESQEYFERFNRGERFDSYVINKDCNASDLVFVYEDSNKCVTVNQHGDKYTICTNGRHRASIAREYGLKLLVCIMNEK